MPHFICRWPGGDVLLASVDSRQELDTILQERCEPGVCKVARYHGPLVLELKPDVPGLSQTSAERFKPPPACPGFQPAWLGRAASSDAMLVAADGSQECVHKLVLQCRMPALEGEHIPQHIQQVRLSCVPDAAVLHSLVQYLYLDRVEQQEQLTPELHCAALACGLMRLVDLCEARFAQHLELQLTSWQGLGPEGQGRVLDSFIGWTLYCDCLGRHELKQLCVHALARHVTAAQSRACWPSLGAATCSLIQLIAVSTAPPLIHRQLMPDGSTILPAHTNPGASGTGSSIVSVDAEAFAAAGGRLTSSEWQQLQKFRSAVAESRERCEASPLVLDQQHMSSCSLTSPDRSPHVTFAVKAPVLGPHKRLMDSVCRFAFPSTHTLLASGWQLKASPDTAAGAGTAAAAGSAAHEPEDTAPVPFAAPDLGTVQAADGSRAAAAAAGTVRPPSAAAAAAAGAVGCEEQAEVSNSDAQQPAGPPARSLLGAGSRASMGDMGAVGSAAGAARPAQQQACLGFRTLRSGRVLSASSAGGSPGSRRSSHGRSSSLRPTEQLLQRSSWGSGLQLAAPEEALAGLEQQQHLQAGLPLPVQRLLQAEEQHSGSWGSCAVSRQPSSPLQPGHDDTVLSAEALRMQDEQLQQQLEVTRVELHARLRSAQQLQQHEGSDMSEAEAMDEMGAVLTVHIQQQQQHTAQESGQACEGQQQSSAMELPAYRGLIICRPSAAALEVASRTAAGVGVGQPASAAAAADAADGSAAVGGVALAGASGLPSLPLAVLQRALVEDFVLYEEASAARQHVVGILVAVEQGDTAAGQRLMAPNCTELIAATAPAAVLNRLAGFLPGATSENAAPSSTAAVVQAAAKYLRSAKGISKLLGMASSSRAALEPSHAQQQQQQTRLLRTLQHISAQLPDLARLLAPHPLAAAAPPAPLAAPLNGGSIGRAGVGMLLQEVQQQQRSGGRPVSGALQAVAVAQAGPDVETYDLGQALAELLQLPELLQGLQLPVLLTQEQYQQREQQLQQLAWQAAAAFQGGSHSSLLGATSPPGTVSPNASSTAGRTGLPEPDSVPVAAAAAAGGSGRTARGVPRPSQTGALFSSILSSLGAAVSGPAAAGYGGMEPGVLGSLSSNDGGASSAASQLSALLGGAQTRPGLLTGVALNGLLEGQGAAAGLVDARSAVAAAAGAAAHGGFTPTGVGALLSGGLLAEGGVAGDSIFDDMAADVLLHGAASVRRITCHGLYELCAALASTADAQTSPTSAATGQPPPATQAAANYEQNESGASGRSSFAGSVGVDAGRVGSGHRSSTGVGTGALGAAINSSRRVSSAAAEGEQHLRLEPEGAAATAAAPDGAGSRQLQLLHGMSGQKRRLSNTAEQPEGQLPKR